MSNKTQLQTNNTALDGYIARINAAKEVAAGLPEAGGGGGGSVETCDCAFLCDAPSMEDATVYYVNANMEVTTKSFPIMDGTRIIVAKNTILTVVPWTSMCDVSGNCSKLVSSHNGGSFIINGDATITYT